jgi:hypothetical protein
MYIEGRVCIYVCVVCVFAEAAEASIAYLARADARHRGAVDRLDRTRGGERGRVLVVVVVVGVVVLVVVAMPLLLLLLLLWGGVGAGVCHGWLCALRLPIAHYSCCTPRRRLEMDR